MKQVPLLETSLRTIGSSDDFLKRFVYAIGGQESNYNPYARGPKTKSGEAAQGLMQVMPPTAKWLQQQFPDFIRDLQNPQDLTTAGVLYAKQAIDFAKKKLGDKAPPNQIADIAARMYYSGVSDKSFNKAVAGIDVSDPVNKGFPTTGQYGGSITRRMADLEKQWGSPVTVSNTTVPATGKTIPRGVDSLAQTMPVATEPRQTLVQGVDNRMAELAALIEANGNRAASVPEVKEMPMQQEEVAQLGQWMMPQINMPFSWDMSQFGVTPVSIPKIGKKK